MGEELYRWQEECLEKWFENGGRGMVQAVTGSGKTLLALTAAYRLAEETKLRIKIVVPTGALMRQWESALKDFLIGTEGELMAGDLNREIGLRGAGCRSSPECRYMIYVINSARYELARQILSELRRGERILLIADECHHYESGQNRLIFEFLPYIDQYRENFFSLGLSATLPSGQAGRYLASVLGRKIYTYGMAEASEGHTVCKYDIYHIRLPFKRQERKEYEELSERMAFLFVRLLKVHPSLRMMDQKERFEMLRRLSGDKDRKVAETASMYMNLAYKRKSLVCLASARISCAAVLTERLPSLEKVLIFGERIRQADELYRLLQEKFPGKVGRYHSRMGQQANKNALERFRTGEIRILIACKAIDEGIDVPDAALGIILSGTAAKRQRMQRLGRILRISEGKNRAALYYLHIEETSEDVCYLPEDRGNRIFELEYSLDRQEFSNPVYDRLAAELLENMRDMGTEQEKIREAVRCLRLGKVRSDWLREQENIEEKIKTARYASDRNYWVCMKKLCISHERILHSR